MRTRIITSIAAGAVALLVGALAPSVSVATGEEHAQDSGSMEAGKAVVGEPVPDLRLPTLDGDRVVRLSSFRGKKLLLIEFASW